MDLPRADCTPRGIAVRELHSVLRVRDRCGSLWDHGEHTLPQVVLEIFANGIVDVSHTIVPEARLCFLAVGNAILISWGGMLDRAFMRGVVTQGAWWYLVPPGLALAWVTLGPTLLANALQEIVNPRLRPHHRFDERNMVAINRLAERAEAHSENWAGHREGGTQ